MKLNKYFYMGIGGAMALMIAGAALLFAQPSAADTVDNAPLALIDIEDGVEHPGRPGRPDRGERVEFLVAELGITQEEFDAAVEAAKEAAIEDALSEGLITEEQAERLLNGEGRRFRGHGQQKAEYLAAALGITVEELSTAMENARAAALEQALVDGDITQEQYDLIQARQALKDFIDREAIMAEILGVTVEELDAAKENGTVRELVEATGLTNEELREAAKAAHDAAIEDAVEAGVITVEQAEALEDAPVRRRGQGRGNGRGPGNFGPGTRGQNGPPAGLGFGNDA